MADPGFFKGGRGGGGWYVGFTESMDHVTKILQFGNWKLIETVTPEILVMPSSLPVWSVCLYFCHNIHNILDFFKVLLPKKGGWLATQSTPLNPPLLHLLLNHEHRMP